MTKDYEADSTVPYFTAQTAGDVERRMQSPYTRAEFVAREVQAGIDTQGRTASTPLGAQVKVVDQDTGAAIRQRAELNAQAAERAGITWRNEAVDTAVGLDAGEGNDASTDDDHAFGTRINQTDKPLLDWLADRVDDLEVSYKAVTARIAGLERRENLYTQAIGELSSRLGVLGQQVTNLEKDLCGLSVATRRSDDDLAGRISTLERLSSALSDRVLGDCEIDDNDEYTPVLDRLDGLASRMSTANARITAIEKAVRGLEQQVARPIVAEIRDPTGARTAYHAIEERAKDEIRMLIREEIGHLADQIHQRVEEVVEEVIQPACETIGEHDRRLSLQLERITELTNCKDEALGRIARLEIGKEHLDRRLAEVDSQLANQLSVQVTWNRDIERQVQRLDGDMALVRDAVCPPQGANRVDPNWNVNDELARAETDSRAVLRHNDDERIMSDGADDAACPSPIEGRLFQKGVVYSRQDRDLLVGRLGKYAEYLRQTRDALRAACLELGADATWSDDTNLADVVSKVLMPYVREWLAGTELSAIRDAVIAASNARHDDLAHALGRAYVALKGLRVYEYGIVEEEMEAIRQVLGNNYRDWLRPRVAE